MIRRAYVTLANGQQIHYRHQGQGYPVILLHPSPLSSAFMTPLITAWSANCHCLAWDTPGYGQSDPLPGEDLSLSPYVESLAGFIRTLELEPPVIYGSATGAQIAIEFGKTYPGPDPEPATGKRRLFYRQGVREHAASLFSQSRSAT